MRKEFKYPIYKTSFSGNEKKYVNSCFKNNWISSSGFYCKTFENKFSKIFSNQYCLATNNGTSALQLTLLSLNLEKNDEVLLPDLTFAASINAVICSNLKPVICDVSDDDYNISLESIKKNTTKKTKVILLVHLYGKSCNLDPIISYANKKGIFIVEDTAEAIGSRWNKKLLGTFGIASSFSFFGNKTITSGEGGMAIFKKKKQYLIAKKIRDHGMSERKRYWHDIVGYNFRMTDLQAAVGLAQLERLDKIINKKIKIANLYKFYLKDLKENIIFIEDRKKEKNSYWLVTFIIKNLNKNKLLKSLKKYNIELRPFFFCLHRMKPYKQYMKHQVKNSLYFEKNGLCLPSYYDLEKKDIKVISDYIKKIVAS